MNEIYVYRAQDIISIAIVEDNRLVEYREYDSKLSIIGNIYRGRVEKILPSIEACFIDIGLEKNAYMSIENNSINLRNGQQVIVQALKEPIGSKGAVVTNNLSLSSRAIVLIPFSNKIMISKKIIDKDLRSKLTQLLKEYSEGYGVIARTQAKDINNEVLLKELRDLISVYQSIKTQVDFLPTPKLLYSNSSVAKIITNDYISEETQNVVVNDKEIFEEIKLIINDNKSISKEIINFDKHYDMNYDMPIQLDIKEALSRRVELMSGGYLIIEETEALTAIDVNSGSYTSALDKSETTLRTNIEAVGEIARQIKLRDIGGIIIVDLIDMKSTEHKNIVIEKLKEYFKKDKSNPRLLSITELGLLEIVRKKHGETLNKRTSVICPTCCGMGRIREKNA